jgi:hypothetical protein
MTVFGRDFSISTLLTVITGFSSVTLFSFALTTGCGSSDFFG